MQVSAEGKRGFILKNWLAQAVSKLALTGKKFTGFCKIMAVTHAKACIIAGCVVTVELQEQLQRRFTLITQIITDRLLLQRQFLQRLNLLH